jgi:hypothetical protein
MSNSGECQKYNVPPQLKNLFSEATRERPNYEKEAIAKLLCKYYNAFSTNEYDLGLTHLAEHFIDTGDAKHVRIPARKVPLAFANEEKKVIDQMHQQGIIQKSNSPWSSPLLLIFKKMER